MQWKYSEEGAAVNESQQSVPLFITSPLQAVMVPTIKIEIGRRMGTIDVVCWNGD